jgi:putative DNA primase/helicase
MQAARDAAEAICRMSAVSVKAPVIRPDFGSIVLLLEHFVLLYGTDSVIDTRDFTQMRLHALRAAFGSDAVKNWLAHEARRMVPLADVVFDPACRSGAHCLNLWTGFSMQPDAARHWPILELLFHLCSSSGPTEESRQAAVDYVLNWLAYPLQNPGAKLSTALVFHGPQGTGKNLFFEIMLRIYGPYGLVVGQDQLEDKFNDWASRKLFVIGDEVVARQELYHHKNKLKALITGRTIQINAKMQPLRTEQNCMNIVFLSNEQQPLALEEGDRRFFVVWCPDRADQALYDSVVQCLDEGGAEGFFNALLGRDLLGFSPHNAPPMTEAKQELIELGLRPHERFMRDWRDGLLPLPMRVCNSEQLYRAFRHWCSIEGERYPPTKELFSKSAAKIGRAWLTHKNVNLEMPDRGRKTHRCWIPSSLSPPEGVTESRWATEAVQAFEADLDAYVRGGVEV